MIDEMKAALKDPNLIIGYGKKVLIIILIFIAVKIILYVGSKIIDKLFDAQKKSRFGFNERKANTLSELLKSLLKYSLYVIAALSILEQVGFKTDTLLIGAGLGGVALGFGAQSLVKDVITGFFILFEDQFSVGEYITIDNLSGIVEIVGLRITKLKDFSGDLHIIPNGLIGKVTNHSRDNSRAVVDIETTYDSDIDEVIKILNNVSQQLRKENSDIVEGPDVQGIIKLGERGMTIRITARTAPMKHGGVEMELREKIKKAFDEGNIHFAYPSSVIVTKCGNN